MNTALVLAVAAEEVRPGWVALVLMLLLGLATFLLWRSMNRQLRKIDVPTKAELREAADVREGRGTGSGAEEDEGGERSST
ncbi:MAG: hypothetical protein M3386_06350 [Actinomycetota bacterium]|nr:hypothetical protein [Actinomycetota bacterium]